MSSLADHAGGVAEGETPCYFYDVEYNNDRPEYWDYQGPGDYNEDCYAPRFFMRAWTVECIVKCGGDIKPCRRKWGDEEAWEGDVALPRSADCDPVCGLECSRLEAESMVDALDVHRTIFVGAG